MQPLLASLLRDDPHAPHAILEKIAERAQRPELARHQFEFNVFDVLIDFEAGDVLIESTLDTGAEGELRLPLAEFVEAMKRALETAGVILVDESGESLGVLLRKSRGSQ